MKPSDTKPKFQFSMKTLMLGITVAAMLSALIGGIDHPNASRALIVITQIGAVLGGSIWGTLFILTKIKPTTTCARITFSVMFSTIPYSICFSVIVVCFMKTQHNSEKGIETINSFGGMISYWISYTLYTNIVSISLLLALLLPLLVVGSVFESLDKRKKIPGPKSHKLRAAFTGMFVGFLMLPALEITNATSQPNPLYFSLLPSVFGLILPPCILTWADWLRAKETTTPETDNAQQETIP